MINTKTMKTKKKNVYEGHDDAADGYNESSAMGNQYGTRTRKNMRARRGNSDPPTKLRIHPTINSKRSKILHSNTTCPRD